MGRSHATSTAPRGQRRHALLALLTAAWCACGWPLGMRPGQPADGAAGDAGTTRDAATDQGTPPADAGIDAQDAAVVPDAPPGMDAVPTADVRADAPRDLGVDAVTPPDAPLDAPPACPTGQTRCGGTCVDLTSNATNCGACGHVCAAGTACTASVCGAVSCSMPQVMCADGCHDLSMDMNNCGACGRICTAIQACISLSGGSGGPYGCCSRAVVRDGAPTDCAIGTRTTIGMDIWCCS